jgi:hypothetical protein
MAGRSFARHRLVAAGFAALLVLAACADDDDGATTDTEQTDDTGSDTTSGELTDSFRGVTADSIKIGFTIVDYDAIAEFVDFNRGDQEAIAQIFVDWINENGGVGGRSVDPVYVTYPPIPGQEPSPQVVCTQLTDDEQVFAVLGVFIDFSGEGQLCLTRDKETIHIGHELEQQWIDEAPPGMLITPDRTPEAGVTTLLNLLEEEGTLEGKTVAVLGDQDAEGRITEVIEPGLDEMGVERGSTAVLEIVDEDTSAAQAQLDSFIERWRTENVDTLVMSGLRASAVQFVDKIRAAFPDMLLIADDSSVVEQAQDAQAAGGTNSYLGMLSVEGETASEAWNDKSELLQECVDVYEDASGETLLGPEEVKPGPDGKTAQIYIAVQDFCGELVMFKTIAEAAGADLTNDSWVDAVNGFGAIDLVNTDIASLCDGKYYADDAARVVEYDPTIGERGDWGAVTDVIDASGGACA